MSVGRPLGVAICLAALVLVGACSGDDPSDPAGSPTSYEQQSFLTDGGNVSFDLPSDWEDFDVDKMQEALDDNEVMDDLTDRMGVSSEQVKQFMSSNVVLFVTAPHASAGYLANVNVIVADGTLPSLGAFELQYRGLGATDVQSTETTTDVGSGYSTTYTLAIRGIEVHGEAIAVGVGGQTVAITISTNDAEETALLGKTIRDSLARSL